MKAPVPFITWVISSSFLFKQTRVAVDARIYLCDFSCLIVVFVPRGSIMYVGCTPDISVSLRLYQWIFIPTFSSFFFGFETC